MLRKFMKGMSKLHLGCGKDIKQGFVNLDSVKMPGVDIVHNLDKYPWPFKDNSFEYVISVSTLEHLSDLINVMEEIHRICRKDAIIEIRVPHFASLGAFKDPTHKLFFSYYSFDYFTKEYAYNFYTKVRFEIVERKIIYGKVFKMFEGLANLFPRFHEIVLRKFLPVQDLSFKLRVKK